VKCVRSSADRRQSVPAMPLRYRPKQKQFVERDHQAAVDRQKSARSDRRLFGCVFLAAGRQAALATRYGSASRPVAEAVRYSVRLERALTARPGLDSADPIA